jgi:hypothetical protein
MNFLTLNTIVLLLGFATSYTVFILTGQWEFGGIAGLNPLKPVEAASYPQLNIHVALTLTWVCPFPSLLFLFLQDLYYLFEMIIL